MRRHGEKRPVALDEGPLHPRAADVLRFVVDYKRAHQGESPTRREIAAGCEIPSTSLVHHHLVMLERRGLVRLGHMGLSRSIAVVGAEWRPPPAAIGAN